MSSFFLFTPPNEHRTALKITNLAGANAGKNNASAFPFIAPCQLLLITRNYV
jgi:hypothetical protein